MNASVGIALLADQIPQKSRVLVVDDVPVQRKMLARRLEAVGYLVECAGDGREALAKMLAGKFEFLITDREMPGLDGAALCQRVREVPLASGYVFIIMLTNRDSTCDFVSGLESGADMYVRKATDPAELLACMKTGQRILTLERALRKSRATDDLLQIYRRDYLDEQLPHEIESAWRCSAPLSLIMMDLDCFKRINDEHGHAAGDQTLREFCARARSVLRQSDWLARYGGEEFTVVLPATPLSGALVVAENVRAACAANPIKTTAGLLAVTVSLGVASLRMGVDSKVAAQNLLERADRVLCESKRAGRNRVTHEPITCDELEVSQASR
jgi:diguanylate cyclase (GGDEF)-like protein